jgi:branched-subunit amino acid permease
VASSLINVGQQVGGSIGLAVLGTVAWIVVASSLRSQPPQQPRQAQMYDHALATGFSRGYLVLAGVLALAVIIALAVIRIRRQDLSAADPAADVTKPDVRPRKPRSRPQP